jgi:CubicO group peptidase (beta-lactamase class C family)
MKKVVSALLASIGLAACAHGPDALVQEASGATSQAVCSGLFVSGLQPSDVYRLQQRPEPGMWAVDWALRYRVDRTSREVRTDIAGGFPSRSVFREGRGCTLVGHTAPPAAIAAAPPEAADLADIAGPALVAPQTPALRAAIDSAFGEPGAGRRRATEAVVIVHDGQVVGERYAPGVGIDTQFDGHSLAKSFVNALVGVLVREGRLDVQDRAAAPEWQASDPRAQITIDELMRMDAGFDFDEGQGASTAGVMWFTQDDIAHFAAEQPLVSSSGRRWHYSSGSYAVLSRVLKSQLGGPQSLSDFAHREVLDPLGMRQVTIEFDGAGTMMGAHAVYASARDWARFGLLYLHDGVVGGRRILPEGWVRYSTTPTLDGGYGAGFWLNTINTRVPTWGFPWGLPGAPSDAFMGRGYLGQWVVIVPSEHLVVVRLGFSHGDAGEMMSVAKLVRDTVTALHASEPPERAIASFRAPALGSFN